MKADWKKVRLDEMGKVSRGRSKHRPRNDSSLFNGEYPFIQTADVKNANLYITEFSQTYNEKGLAQSKLWNKGTLCITIAANIADTAILGIDACFPDSIMGFIPNTEISDVKYVKYCFDILQKECQSISVGAAQDNLSWEKLSRIKFSCPPLETQQKIASILSAYDDLIENNRKQIKLLEEAAQRLYKEWFVDLRFPGYENVAIVDGVPEGWSYERIDSFVELQNGFAFKSDSFDNNGNYKIITIKNVQDGSFDSSNVNKINKIPSKMPQWCKLEIGDILLSLTGNVGRVCLVTSNNCLLNQRVAKLKSKYPAFTYTLFRSKDMFVMMNNLANGAAQQNLSPIRTGEQKILKATEEIINKFNAIANCYVDKIVMLHKQIEILQQARDKLLPRLMSGEMEV